MLRAKPFRAEKTGCPLCRGHLTLDLAPATVVLAKDIQGYLLPTCNLIQ